MQTMSSRSARSSRVCVGTNPTDEGAVASRGVRPAQETEYTDEGAAASRGVRPAQETKSKKQCARDRMQETVCKGQCAKTANPNQTDT